MDVWTGKGCGWLEELGKVVGRVHWVGVGRYWKIKKKVLGTA